MAKVTTRAGHSQHGERSFQVTVRGASAQVSKLATLTARVLELPIIRARQI